MSAAQYLYKRFRLNGRLVEVRRVEDGVRPEVVVRYVNDNDELSANEFNLTLRFLLMFGQQVRVMAGVAPKQKRVAGVLMGGAA